jgi:hypothetical protein
MISAYRLWETLAICSTDWPLGSKTAVGCECRTKGTAKRPCKFACQTKAPRVVKYVSYLDPFDLEVLLVL